MREANDFASARSAPASPKELSNLEAAPLSAASLFRCCPRNIRIARTVLAVCEAMRELNEELSTDPVACDVDVLDGPAEAQRSGHGSLGPLTLGDAISVMSYATRHRDAEIELPELFAAGAALLAHVCEQQRELDRERARWAGALPRARAARVAGAPLIERTDAGGPRHHLGGAPVHAGDSLLLLTDVGWLKGRYEWGWKSGTPPLFFFSLPGVDIQISIALPPGTRLAWPDEIEGPTTSDRQ
jgi:hypothetical protein